MLKRLIIIFLLRPLVQRDYRLRAEGKLPDDWHWADRLWLRWGHLDLYENIIPKKTP